MPAYYRRISPGSKNNFGAPLRPTADFPLTFVVAGKECLVL
jgi:hypothetical protein